MSGFAKSPCLMTDGCYGGGDKEVTIMHYVCPECGGVADHKKVCETSGCSREGHEMMECDCTDNKHEGVLEAANNKEKKEEE